MIPWDELELQSLLVSLVVRGAGALVVIIVGRWLAGKARNWVRAAVQRGNISASLQEIFSRSTYYLVLLLTFLAALVILGVSVEALIGVIGLVIIIAAIALRESLRDLAATVIFFIFQPFKPGDLIETNGITGRVQEILLFNTVIISLDNRKLVVPNGNIQNTNLMNYSAMENVRLDIQVRLTYAQDILTARNMLFEIAKSDPRALTEPAPIADVMEMQADGVYLVFRVFVKPDDFFALRPALTEKIKLEFDRKGLAFPMPQLDVRTIAEGSGVAAASA